MNKYAFATLLASDDYLIPVCALFYSLQYYKTQYDFIIIATDALSVETFEFLNQLKIQYYVFPDIRFKVQKTLKEENHIGITQQNLFLTTCLNKFYIFDLKQYDKVCFLDGDMIAKANLDFVFNFSTPAGKILNNSQVAAEVMIISPKDYDSKNIFEKFGTFAFDEGILCNLYSIDNICDLHLSDWSHLLLHAHAHCCRFRYWEFFNIQNIDQCFKFVEELITMDNVCDNFTTLKNYCGDLCDQFFEYYDTSIAFKAEDNEDLVREKISKLNIQEFAIMYQNFLKQSEVQ